MRKHLGLYIILISVVPFLASIPLQFRTSSRDTFCASCHEMKPMVASFRSSTHATVGCMGCHTDPGQLNFVRDKVRDGAKDIYGHFFGYHKPIKTTVPNFRCLSCHPGIGKRNVFRQLEVAHDQHLAAGVQCVQCHLKVGHQTFTLASAPRSRPVVFRSEQTHRRQTVATCFASGCHDGRKAPSSCATCHLDQQRIKPKSHDPGFLTLHGAQARDDARGCLTCHKADTQTIALTGNAGVGLLPGQDFAQLMASRFCRKCHESENPHPPGFELIHGKVARSETANCANCHRDEKKFCAACHGTEMPHPEKFEATHGATAKSKKVDCLRCHDAAKDCTGCHRSTRPKTHAEGFRETHGTLAKKKPDNCKICHEATTCMSCHQLDMPHPERYALNHTEDAARRESTCANCHKRKDCLECHEEEEVHIPNVRLPEAPEPDPVRRMVLWLGSPGSGECPREK